MLLGVAAMAQQQRLSFTAPKDNLRQGFTKLDANDVELYTSRDSVAEVLADTVELGTAISELVYFQLPQRTTTQINAISSPQNGMFCFNVTTGEIWYYSAGDWRIIAIEE